MLILYHSSAITKQKKRMENTKESKFRQIHIWLVGKMVPFRFHFPISRGESLPLAPQGALAAVTEVQRRAVNLWLFQSWT